MAAKKTAKKTAKKAAAKKTASVPKTAKKAAKAPKKRSEVPTSGQSGKPIDLGRDKLNGKELSVVSVLASDANAIPINALAASCFPQETASKANSWVRNSLRRLVRGKWVEKVSRGTYRLHPEGKQMFDSDYSPSNTLPPPQEEAPQHSSL